MTKFLQPSFSHCTAGNKAYATGWDAVFGKKQEPKEEYVACIVSTEQGDQLFTPDAKLAAEWDEAQKKRTDPAHGSPLAIWTAELEAAREKTLNRLRELDAENCGHVRSVRGEPESFCALEKGHGFPPGHVYAREWQTSDIREQVEKFHDTYEIPVAVTPTVPERKLLDKQLRCIFEEALELLDASGGDPHDTDWLREIVAIAIRDRNHAEVDLVELADACGDVDYTVESLRLVCGINGKPIADEIQRSNMSKLDENGRPLKRADGKILKGPNYSPPDIARELRAQGWEG